MMEGSRKTGGGAEGAEEVASPDASPRRVRATVMSLDLTCLSAVKARGPFALEVVDCLCHSFDWMSHGPCVGPPSDHTSLHDPRCRVRDSIRSTFAPSPIFPPDHHEPQIPRCSLSRCFSCAPRCRGSARTRPALNRYVSSSHHPPLYPQLFTRLATCLQFRATSLKVRFGVTVVASPRVQCRFGNSHAGVSPKWLGCEHFTCPRYTQLTVVLAYSSNVISARS